MTGIQEVVFSVYDIARASAALIAVGDYRLMALPDADAAQAAAWHVPAGYTRIEQALLLPPDDDKGALRLVAFHGLDRDLIRPSQRTWDSGGIFDLDLFSRDVRGVYRKLQRDHGWTAFGEPVDYEIGDFDVTQVVAIGPDGLVLAVIQPHKPPTLELPAFTALSRIFNSTQIVRDFDATLAFYRDVLEWRPMMDTTIDDAIEPGAEVLGLPMPHARSCVRRVGIVHPTGSNDGSVELIEIGLAGRDFAERAVAPNVGLLALRIEVPSVAAYAAGIIRRGGVLYTAATRLDLAGLGRVELFSIRTPDGAILEFYEVLRARV